MLTAYRAALPGVAFLCSLIAFVLTLCCLLAGTNPNTLQSMELYTLNTSQISTTLVHDLGLAQGDPHLNFSTLLPRDDLASAVSSATAGLESSGTQLAGSLESNAVSIAENPTQAITDLKNNITHTVEAGKKELTDAVSKAEDAMKNATGEIVSLFINKTVQELHIRDFYVAHLLTYCEGNYTAGGKEELTYCSNHKPNNKYSFNVTGNETTAADDDDPLGFIKELHLPDPIEYAMKAATLIAKVISAFYIVGIIGLFLSIISAGLTFPAYFTAPNVMGSRSTRNTILRWVTLASSGGAFFLLFLATVMVHFLAKEICGLFDKHPKLGVAAHVGGRFQGCSWAAVILIGIAVTLAIVDLVVDMATNGARSRMESATKRRWFGRPKNAKDNYEL